MSSKIYKNPIHCHHIYWHYVMKARTVSETYYKWLIYI
jgi:hypothetical protein